MSIFLQLDVFRGEISSGNITFGLIRGVEYIDTRHGTLMDTFYTCRLQFGVVTCMLSDRFFFSLVFPLQLVDTKMC